jgi:hypothetical protein
MQTVIDFNTKEPSRLLALSTTVVRVRDREGWYYLESWWNVYISIKWKLENVRKGNKTIGFIKKYEVKKRSDEESYGKS